MFNSNSPLSSISQYTTPSESEDDAIVQSFVAKKINQNYYQANRAIMNLLLNAEQIDNNTENYVKTTFHSVRKNSDYMAVLMDMYDTYPTADIYPIPRNAAVFKKHVALLKHKSTSVAEYVKSMASLKNDKRGVKLITNQDTLAEVLLSNFMNALVVNPTSTNITNISLNVNLAGVSDNEANISFCEPDYLRSNETILNLQRRIDQVNTVERHVSRLTAIHYYNYYCAWKAREQFMEYDQNQSLKTRYEHFTNENLLAKVKYRTIKEFTHDDWEVCKEMKKTFIFNFNTHKTAYQRGEVLYEILNEFDFSVDCFTINFYWSALYKLTKIEKEKFILNVLNHKDYHAALVKFGKPKKIEALHPNRWSNLNQQILNVKQIVQFDVTPVTTKTVMNCLKGLVQFNKLSLYYLNSSKKITNEFKLTIMKIQNLDAKKRHLEANGTEEVYVDFDSGNVKI